MQIKKNENKKFKFEFQKKKKRHPERCSNKEGNHWNRSRSFVSFNLPSQVSEALVEPRQSPLSSGLLVLFSHLTFTLLILRILWQLPLPMPFFSETSTSTKSPPSPPAFASVTGRAAPLCELPSISQDCNPWTVSWTSAAPPPMRLGGVGIRARSLSEPNTPPFLAAPRRQRLMFNTLPPPHFHSTSTSSSELACYF